MTLEAGTGGEISTESLSDMFLEDVQTDTPDTETPEIDTATATDDDTLEPNTPEPEETDTTETEEPKLAPEEVVSYKHGDKEGEVPKEALFDLKVNGKIEQVTLQEMKNRASAVINADRVNAELGRERKAFKDEQNRWGGEVDRIAANMEAIIATEDPLQMAEYIADLKGVSPEEVYEKILQSSYNHLLELQEMTPKEREQAKQLRQYDRQRKQEDSQRKVWEQRSQQQTKVSETQRMVEEEGFTMGDFQGALDEVTEKVKNGETLGYGLDEIKEINESVIVDYLVVKDVNTRVVSALGAENKEMASDENFINKVVGAVIRTESLDGKLEANEVAEFIKQALRLEGKAVKESLTRRVASSATSSKNTISNSKENEETDPDEFKDFMDGITL